jgi:hypothetical protein
MPHAPTAAHAIAGGGARCATRPTCACKGRGEEYSPRLAPQRQHMHESLTNSTCDRRQQARRGDEPTSRQLQRKWERAPRQRSHPRSLHTPHPGPTRPYHGFSTTTRDPSTIYGMRSGGVRRAGGPEKALVRYKGEGAYGSAPAARRLQPRAECGARSRPGTAGVCRKVRTRMRTMCARRLCRPRRHHSKRGMGKRTKD